MPIERCRKVEQHLALIPTPTGGSREMKRAQDAIADGQNAKATREQHERITGMIRTSWRRQLAARLRHAGVDPSLAETRIRLAAGEAHPANAAVRNRPRTPTRPQRTVPGQRPGPYPAPNRDRGIER